VKLRACRVGTADSHHIADLKSFYTASLLQNRLLFVVELLLSGQPEQSFEMQTADLYQSILRESDPAKRRELAQQLQSLAESGSKDALVPLATLQLFGLNAMQIDTNQARFQRVYDISQPLLFDGRRLRTHSKRWQVATKQPFICWLIACVRSETAGAKLGSCCKRSASRIVSACINSCACRIASKWKLPSCKGRRANCRRKLAEARAVLLGRLRLLLVLFLLDSPNFELLRRCLVAFL